MVKFGWPVKTTKHSPSSERRSYPSLPPYQGQDHASPVAFPSTSTTASGVPTTVTNTPTASTSTTHFLSLPIWRKRHEEPVDSSQRMSMFELRTHQAGLDHHQNQGTPSSREKSLPPTPASSNEDVSDARMRSTDSPISERSWLYSPSTQPRSSRSPTASPPVRPTPSNAKFALAQAALAIGLPHGMPQASASSSRSDVDSAAFGNVPQPSRHPVPRPNVRRAKSFQQLSRKFCRDDDGTSSDTQRPRSRGTSFDPAHASDSNGKGKANALEDIPSHVTPPRKSLVRRPSFWNRKRNDTSSNDVAPPPPPPPPPSERPRTSFDHLSTLLPTLRPMSPLHFDTNTSHSSPLLQIEDPSPPSPPGLDAHNESHNIFLPPNPSASSPDLSIQTFKKSSASRQRPSTADPAADRYRTLPFYKHPPDHSSPLAAAPSQQQVATPQQTTRPRSQTNPPLLHRLSANLFSFGSSPLSPPTNGAHINQSPTASSLSPTTKPPPPNPRPNESPATYVDRLLWTINKADVASVLASRYDLFS